MVKVLAYGASTSHSFSPQRLRIPTLDELKAMSPERRAKAIKRLPAEAKREMIDMLIRQGVNPSELHKL